MIHDRTIAGGGLYRASLAQENIKVIPNLDKIKVKNCLYGVKFEDRLSSKSGEIKYF